MQKKKIKFEQNYNRCILLLRDMCVRPSWVILVYFFRFIDATIIMVNKDFHYLLLQR